MHSIRPLLADHLTVLRAITRRVDWAAHDVCPVEQITVEKQTAGWLQGWRQQQAAQISFGHLSDRPVAGAYAAIKHELAARYRTQRAAYSDAKGLFIQATLARAETRTQRTGGRCPAAANRGHPGTATGHGLSCNGHPAITCLSRRERTLVVELPRCCHTAVPKP